MNGFGDNPFDDGLDFVGCPPLPNDLILPDFPEEFGRQDCKLICWGRCLPVPDGERRMNVVVENFESVRGKCGVYSGFVRFVDSITGDVWYEGKLEFYYTRNYIHTGESIYGDRSRSIAFRFVAKGDLVRVADDMPEWECLILCTKQEEITQKGVQIFEKIFVYGGLEILYDIEAEEMKRYILSLGHNDGWYTHHPQCSARPIVSHGRGDYIGHYCDRGWLFVSPGRNFVFDPAISPPTGVFTEEALRAVGKKCVAEEAIKYGELALQFPRCIYWYQELKGETVCKTLFRSVELCQGVVGNGEKPRWLTFFSMGYWMDRYQKKKRTLHLVEGNIKLNRSEEKERGYGLYFYGFANQYERQERKLVDLASNKDVIGAPVDSRLLLYLYNAGHRFRDPKVRFPLEIDQKLLRRILREEIIKNKDKDPCPFLEEREE